MKFNIGITRIFPIKNHMENSLKTIIITGKVKACAPIDKAIVLAIYLGNLYKYLLILLENNIIPKVAPKDKITEILHRVLIEL